MWSIAERVDINPEDGEEVASFARDNGIGLVVIGPEAPLVSGVADAVRAAGIPVFGPNAAAARMEGSKQFAKRLWKRREFQLRLGVHLMMKMPVQLMYAKSVVLLL